MAFPCDRYVSNPKDAYHRAVDVEAPPGVVFRWLCQLRVAPYSYDWIDNFGRRSPRTLTPGIEHLEAGQTVMSIFELVEFERDRHLTIVLRRGRRLAGDLAVTYLIASPEKERSRLVVKLLFAYPGRRLLPWLAARLFPGPELVMMRKQLLTLKDLAEAQASIEASY
jgi:hypothetical protein